ncbi:RES family NAD+ phosphorylase [Variovorax sp. J31P179]|uniref:RES family NAD+ phosphorylase n=1 Tax=Variovorax sp. J31P179 TaxID=3053508 RepID=UPI002575DEAB|nr:RES family NAD+ phosphorylase [Variovorax sp. J31P179]MDM0085670.1 RES family NAD+ phosphorylase [Variovorax sp. J31P179]
MDAGRAVGGLIEEELKDVREGFGPPLDGIDQEASTQSIGMTWRQAGEALGLWVPSAVEPSESNIILNPDHPAFLQVVVTVERNPFEFDDRMFPSAASSSGSKPRAQRSGGACFRASGAMQHRRCP